MWKTLVDFSAQISRFKHILPLSTAQINCSGTDLPLFRKPYINKVRESRAEEARPRWRLFHGGLNNAEHLRRGRWHAPSPKTRRGANASERRFVGEFEMTLKMFNGSNQRQ
jgi:hypothetical protein